MADKYDPKAQASKDFGLQHKNWVPHPQLVLGPQLSVFLMVNILWPSRNQGTKQFPMMNKHVQFRLFVPIFISMLFGTEVSTGACASMLAM